MGFSSYYKFLYLQRFQGSRSEQTISRSSSTYAYNDWPLAHLCKIIMYRTSSIRTHPQIQTALPSINPHKCSFKNLSSNSSRPRIEATVLIKTTDPSPHALTHAAWEAKFQHLTQSHAHNFLKESCNIYITHSTTKSAFFVVAI